jgi:hypothetical protein
MKLTAHNSQNCIEYAFPNATHTASKGIVCDVKAHDFIL